MMKNLLRTIVFFVCVSAMSGLQAQKFKGFSGNSDTYIDELTEMVASDVNLKGDQKKDYEALLTEYGQVWSNFSIQHRKDIVKLSQLMAKKNARARNGFYEFIQTQIAFQSSKQSPESYNQWLKGMQEYIANHNLKIYNSAVVATYNLLGGGYLYLSKTVHWNMGDAGGYVFRNDSVRGVYADINSEIDLTYGTITDSNTIHSTKGRFYLMENSFEGQGGIVNWEKTGLQGDEVYVELDKYTVALNRATIFADSVTFTNKEFFSHKLKGRFEDLCSDGKAGKDDSYPRFYSYKKEEIIKNIYPDVDYVGGFTQQGGKFLGTGDVKMPAELRFYKEGKVYIRAKAIEHPFSREGIITKDCQVTIYTNQDSIYHPSTKMNFNKSNRQIFFNDYREGISASPWVDSYHCIDIYTEAVYANLDDYKIEFTAVKGPARETFATFESNNYYSEDKWNKLQGIDEQNPLFRIQAFVKKTGKEQFTVKQFSKFIGLEPVQAKLMLMNVALNGFIIYESYRETAIVKPKLYDYIAANRKRADYDALRFVSATKGEPNAVLNVLDMELRMNGIEKFTLSDTHNVSIRPLNGSIRMKKNRSFEFDGDVMAGRFKMTGKDCKFSYEQFALDLPSIDSLNFYVPLYDDSTKLVMIQTPIQHLYCKLLIDEPNNKSSLKKVEGYPIMSSLENSYVYYDSPKIQNGVYNRERFYYKLDTFQIKNLFNFKTDSVRFEGVFVSDGIFEEIKEPLVVMRDYSLGFKMETPSTGLATYNGKGQFYNSIDLSCNGLLGTGYLDYLASRSYSKMFVFHPDSAFCITEKFVCFEKSTGKSSAAFAKVDVTQTSEHWYPKADYMFVEQKAEAFNMYDGKAFHTGSLTVSPDGLTGTGSTKSEEMIVSSELTKFKNDNYTSDTANFVLNALDGNSIAFKADNVRAKVDFTTEKGEFISNEGVSKTELPFLQYSCYVDKFAWDMDNKQLALVDTQSPKAEGFASKNIRELVDSEQPGAKFVSTHPNQGGLHFNSSKATLDLTENKLSAGEVYLIKCADAGVRPGDGMVTIYPGAQMDTLENATILANTESKLHEYRNARIHVASSQIYSENGYIDYVDEDGKNHPVFISELNPLSGQSVGKGDITKDSSLALSSAFNFFGKVTVNAQDSNFHFDGGVQISANCNDREAAWIKFSAPIDPQAIYIPVSEAPVDIENNRITASVLFNEDNFEPKIAFLTSDTEGDNVMLSAKGYLTYDKAKKNYIIASKQKLEDFEQTGEYLSYNKTRCDIKGEGNIKMGLPVSSAVQMNNYGTVTVDKNNEAVLQMSLAINFPFSQQALDLMGVELYEDLNLSPIDLENSAYKQYLKYIYGEEKGEEWFEDLLVTGEWKSIPKEVASTLFFPSVRLVWDPVKHSYIGTANAQLGYVGNYQINKTIRTKIQLIKTTLTTEIRIYVEANPDHWYFFTYNGAAMSALSSNETFNSIINDTPRKDRETETKGGKLYTYRLATPAEKRNFIRNLELGDQYEEKETDNTEE